MSPKRPSDHEPASVRRAAGDEQYFAPNPHSASAPYAFTCTVAQRRFTFWTDAGVFSRRHLDRGTELLLAALPLPLTGWGVDLGCGYGPLGVIVAALSPQARLDLVDINVRAVALARRNVQVNGLSPEQVRVWPGDGLAAIPGVTEGALSFVVTNPPIRAGKERLHQWVQDARWALSVGGRLYLVIRTQQGAVSFGRYLEEVFGPGQCDLLERGSGYRVFAAERR